MRSRSRTASFHAAALLPIISLLFLAAAGGVTWHLGTALPDCISKFCALYGEVELSLQVCPAEDQAKYNRTRTMYYQAIVLDISFACATVIFYMLWVLVRRGNPSLERFLLDKQAELD
ncbi:Transmembrane domain-containing protein [Spironucleus salmonicida]|uniref:Transmembrane domain-containing protein n=1 Tax=Spironucleus salmonicida TaxID=348837 RepID=V6LTF6_9EUKA|nr:Transmembrane domain-containing protein [Spironucleus salmonicida]KAH0576375.1 Transmembrane domain-containing protein [Spironucleus salmonicida]|eukprot:EST46976.1 Transmembrane domain-containing protein [Spironucleus salmonicida]